MTLTQAIHGHFTPIILTVHLLERTMTGKKNNNKIKINK